MNKILITGSNGLLGQKLVSLLANKSNCQLIATSRVNLMMQPFLDLIEL